MLLLTFGSHSQTPATIPLNPGPTVRERDIECVFISAFMNSMADYVGQCIGFLDALDFASASIVYELGDPAFVLDGYTVG